MLADKLDISKVQLKGILGDGHSDDYNYNITIDTLVDVCKLFNKSVDFMLFGIE